MWDVAARGGAQARSTASAVRVVIAAFAITIGWSGCNDQASTDSTPMTPSTGVVVPEGSSPVVIATEGGWQVLDADGLRDLDVNCELAGVRVPVAVTSDGRVVYAVEGTTGTSLRIVPTDGSAAPTSTCADRVALSSDDAAGVWALTAADDDTQSADLEHFDSLPNRTSSTLVRPVPDAHPFAEGEPELTPEFVYTSHDQVIVQNRASNGVYRGGPFNLARLGPDGIPQATTQTSLRVEGAVPNPDGSVLALTTTGSGGGCSVENRIDFLDLTTFQIERSIDLTTAVLGHTGEQDETVIASPGQWVADHYITHVWSVTFPDGCGTDRGWLVIDSTNGGTTLLAPDVVSSTLGVPREPRR